MKKHIKIVLTVALSLSLSNIAFAEENQAIPSTLVNAKTNTSQGARVAEATNIVDISNKTAPNLIAPVAEDPKLQKKTDANKQEKTHKLDLRAVIFDPKADFKAQAEEEGREMTRLEEAEYDIHEALHGEVCSMKDMSKKGLLSKYSTWKPEGGILESLTEYTGYRGTLSGVWQGEDYKNTLYSVDTLSTTFEGKFKDKKTSFRSMFFFQPGKEGHDFFNDLWGDQYIQYAWSKSKNDQILVGYARNTYDIEGSMSPWILPFINRTQIAKTYNNARSLQVKAQGTHKMYDYSMALSSAGRYFMDWFPGPEFTGSLAVKPLGLTDGKYGKLLAGGGLNAGNAENRYTVGTAFMDYEYKRINATVEYGSAEGSNGSIGYAANHPEGFNGTIAYRLTPKWQILARYDQFDPNKSKKNDIRREYTAGLNYFIKDQALRVMLNYTVYSVETGVYGSRILVGTQVLI